MELHCTHCGSALLEPGFILDANQGSSYAKWVTGPLELGFFGGARVWNKTMVGMEAFRCTVGSHLELFVPPPPFQPPPPATPPAGPPRDA